MRSTGCWVALGLCLWPMSGWAQLADRKGLTLEGARQAIAAAVGEARKAGATGVIAVVDEGGNLMALERIDGTFAAGANTASGELAVFREQSGYAGADIAEYGQPGSNGLTLDGQGG